LRRASRGWAESTGAGASVEVGALEGPTPARRVSWRPGAEGAEVDLVVWVKLVAGALAGVIRIDFWFGSIGLAFVLPLFGLLRSVDARWGGRERRRGPSWLES
jgi:hypothetical protein